MKEIVPTILTKDPLDLQQKWERADHLVPRVQIDVVDGIFVANKTCDLAVVKEWERDFKLDVHLMVKEPVNWINRCLEVLSERVIAQVEMMSNVEDYVQKVVAAGMEVGLALDLATPVEKISAETYPKLDAILLMAVGAGFGGQEFDSKVLGKIKKIKALVGDLVEIMVDGGLDEGNIVKCKEAGAEVFCLGKTFWEAADLSERYLSLTKIIQN